MLNNNDEMHYLESALKYLKENPAKFQIGDVVEITAAGSHKGLTGVVRRVILDNWQREYIGSAVVEYSVAHTHPTSSNNRSTDSDIFSESQLKLISRTNYLSKKGGIMSKVVEMARLFIDKDAQALIEAGYLSQDLSLTVEGHAALDLILVNANKSALVAAAKATTGEVEKAKKA